MPIERIIDGLRQAVLRHCDDKALAEYVSDAIDALTDQDKALDDAFQEGKRTQLEECFETVLRLSLEVQTWRRLKKYLA